MSEDRLIGEQLDEYRLEKLLGQGGMARVYRGLDVGLKRYAAIKVISTPFRRDEEYLRRFEVEAQAIAQLDHPNIVSLYRYGQSQDVLYMAMKYVEGADLHAILCGYEETGDLMPWDEVLRMLREIASALDYAHGKGVIHRDIKPSNIMIDTQGRAYLTDFGLALLTAQGTQGQIFGTPQYIAPEQAISSAGAVPQSDFYAIGVILYRMVTGVLPFNHDDLLEIAMLHMTEPPPPPSQHRPEISPELEAVILKCLAKEPRDRYPNGAALVTALEGIGKQSALPMAAATLSIMDRVALDMERLPPPPVSPGINAAAPSVADDATASMVMPPPPTKQTAAPAAIPLTIASDPTPQTAVFSPKLIGIAVVVLLLLLAGGLALFGGGDDAEGEMVTAVTPTIDFVDENTTLSALPSETTTAAVLPVAESSEVKAATELETTPTATTAPPSTPLPEATATLLPSAEPTAEPSPIPSLPTTYRLAISSDKNTLFITNLSDTPLALTSLALAFDEDEPFSRWPVNNLAPETCILLVKDGKSPSDKLDKTPCQQISGTIEQDWDDNFSVYYQEMEIDTCRVKGKSDCQLEWLVP